MINLLMILIAKYLFLGILLLAAFYFYKLTGADKINFIFYTVFVGILSFVLSKISGHLYNDPRPFVVGHFTPLIPHAADNGFPSDHVLLSSTISTAVFKFNKKIGFGLFILSLIVGLARMYVGIHHFVDIISAIIISVISGVIVYSIGLDWMV